jgi:hypothetical protein
MSARPRILRQQQGFLEKQRWSRGPIVGIVILILILIGIYFGIVRGYLSLGWRQHTGYVILAGTLGAVVGASELISRYRDEPVLALRTTVTGPRLLVHPL